MICTLVDVSRLVLLPSRVDLVTVFPVETPQDLNETKGPPGGRGTMLQMLSLGNLLTLD